MYADIRDRMSSTVGAFGASSGTLASRSRRTLSISATISAASFAVATRSRSCFLRSCAVKPHSRCLICSAKRLRSASPFTFRRGSNSTRSKTFVTIVAWKRDSGSFKRSTMCETTSLSRFHKSSVPRVSDSRTLASISRATRACSSADICTRKSLPVGIGKISSFTPNFLRSLSAAG